MNSSNYAHPFAALPQARPDPIFGLLQTYLADARDSKVNLGIGMYYDEHGALQMLESVRLSIGLLREIPETSEYLPMGGYSEYRRKAQQLVFGNGTDLDPRCLATIQTLGGSGALRIGADILRRHCFAREIWISDPGWDNHAAIFQSAGLDVRYYPYLTKDGRQVDFEAMLASFESLPPFSVVVIHTCCHNPSGIDLSPTQWETLTSLFRDKELIPFLDFAYQGFARGVEEDAYPVRWLSMKKIPFLVASSFSKNFGLYNQRCGVLNAFCSTPAEANCMQGQMEGVVRSSYSNPPAYGARIITEILMSDLLSALWRTEVDQMRERITLMRQRLVNALVQSHPQNAALYTELPSRNGMFITTGLTAPKILWLRKHFGIYLVENGRLCLAGLNNGNIEYVAAALAQAFEMTGDFN